MLTLMSTTLARKPEPFECVEKPVPLEQVFFVALCLWGMLPPPPYWWGSWRGRNKFFMLPFAPRAKRDTERLSAKISRIRIFPQLDLQRTI